MAVKLSGCSTAGLLWLTLCSGAVSADTPCPRMRGDPACEYPGCSDIPCAEGSGTCSGRCSPPSCSAKGTWRHFCHGMEYVCYRMNDAGYEKCPDRPDCAATPGYFCNWTLGGTLTACRGGSFSSEAGASACLLCPSGTFSEEMKATSGAVCRHCPPGTTSLPGSGNLTDCGCPKGSTGPDGGGPCTECAAGHYKGSLGSASCSSCAAGTFSAKSGVSACTRCEMGKYSTATGATSAAVCTDCPAGKTSEYGSDAISACKDKARIPHFEL